MIQYSVVTTQPASEPITLKEAKTHLEVIGTSKDTYITSLITTARRLCEAYAGLSFVTQTRRVKLDYFPCDKLYIELPYGPVQSITTFSYLNDAAGTTTLTADVTYKLDIHSRLARVYKIDSSTTEIETWPTNLKDVPHPITITYVAGYDSAINETQPEQIKQAILMYLTKYFENRGDTQGKGFDDALPWECMHILDSIKVTWNANYE